MDTTTDTNAMGQGRNETESRDNGEVRRDPHRETDDLSTITYRDKTSSTRHSQGTHGATTAEQLPIP